LGTYFQRLLDTRQGIEADNQQKTAIIEC